DLQGAYTHLRRHWQFSNALMLFEVHDQVVYGIHIYGVDGGVPDFIMASSLYHPETVEKSLLHNGDGVEPGLKTADGYWDMSAHASRVIKVAARELEDRRSALGDETVPLLETPMLYTVNQSSLSVLKLLSQADRLRNLNPKFSSGWHEKADRQNGRFKLLWGAAESWCEAIMQGPAFFVGTSFYKQPNSTMKHNQDWSEVDLEQLPGDAVPLTSYKTIRDGEYDRLYTHWALPNGDRVPARDYYRIAWRRMAANTGERTLIPAIIPPGVAHVNAVFSVAIFDHGQLLQAACSMSSLLADFQVRSVPHGAV